MTRSAKLYRYRLPMDSRFMLRNQPMSERVGFIVELVQGSRIGYGEVAPLDGVSAESIEQAGLQAQRQLEIWACDGEMDYSELLPSVAFGLSIAELELSGQLPQQGNYHTAPLYAGDSESLFSKMNELSQHPIVRIKLGKGEPAREGLLVNQLLESVPELTLRLDANRAWDLQQAAQFAKPISPSLRQRIAYVEEPCLHPSDSVSFAINSGIAIAWDETLLAEVRRPDFAVKDIMGVKTLALKPSLLGSVEYCRNLIEQAKALSVQIVISSSFESSLGLNQLARLAHWLVPEQIPSLDTAQFFTHQLEKPWPNCDLPLQSLHDQEMMWRS
ncbi:o-succinylbenzoate synthase [Vibrio profundum]|uniref:o-succinylbenzoate synthase n=1 Tax=Vibrio profundum TaxID=2910247 RepID=UPI003D0ACB79